MSEQVYRRAVMLSEEALLSNLEELRKLYGNSVTFAIPETLTARYEDKVASVVGSEAIDVDGLPFAELLGVGEIGGLHSAVWLRSHVLGIRDAAAGEGISYGATHILEHDSQIALAPVGFADGIDRKLSGSLSVLVEGHSLPVLGRIAMDSISFDVTDLTVTKIGTTVDIFRSESGFGFDRASQILGTTTAELAIRLSERAEVILCR